MANVPVLCPLKTPEHAPNFNSGLIDKSIWPIEGSSKAFVKMGKYQNKFLCGEYMNEINNIASFITWEVLKVWQ